MIEQTRFCWHPGSNVAMSYVYRQNLIGAPPRVPLRLSLHEKFKALDGQMVVFDTDVVGHFFVSDDVR